MRPDPQETADLAKFTEEILNGKLHFLCSVKAEGQTAETMAYINLKKCVKSILASDL